MAEQQKAAEPARLSITAEDLKEILAAAIAQGQKPYVDPEKVRQAEAAKARIAKQRETSERETEARQSACSHLREDNTSRIAWNQFHHVERQLYIWEGFCQMCNKHFFPGMKPKGEYERMIRVPSGKPGIIG